MGIVVLLDVVHSHSSKNGVIHLPKPVLRPGSLVIPTSLSIPYQSSMD